MEKHHTSASAYVLTWVLLTVLTTATFLLSRVHLGPLQVPVAMFIAVIKGLMVVLIFMHLLELRSVNRVFFAMGVSFIVLLVALMVTDVVNR